MTYRGTVKGKTIELSEALPYPEGQAVEVSVMPKEQVPPLGSPSLLLRVLHQPPFPDADTVAAFSRAIEEGRLPVKDDELGFEG